MELQASDQMVTQNKDFSCSARKYKYSALKPFTANYFSLNFKNLSTIFCPELSEETLPYFWLNPDPLELTVSGDFDILKFSFAFRVDIFKPIEFCQINLVRYILKSTVFDFFSKYNFVTENCSNWIRPVFIKSFYFSIKMFLSLRFPCIFKAVKLKKEFSCNFDTIFGDIIIFWNVFSSP